MSKSVSKNQAQDVDVLVKYKCTLVESNKYSVYNCDGSNRVSNIREVIDELLGFAVDNNAVIRLFRVYEVAPQYQLALSVTRGGLISIEIRLPTRLLGGKAIPRMLSVNLNELPTVLLLFEKLKELAQQLT